ncbi:hypothetical protein LV476_04895 [Guyparkeria hydrothermalis]|uniref:hypothetical protein n=1 Tax=Guyparkeria hydrothermalis TaxID=923 RepID=UPI002020DF63|nr:hypothetical protein [Guyparkeria hydrothermalis]MCL7744289.1 hypothetical protein [Guyparkeria hydrothermalis]
MQTMQLETVNRLLAESRLPRFTRQGFESAIKTRGPGQVMRAVQDLREKRKGVDVFLRNLVREHGAESSSEPESDLRQRPSVKDRGRDAGDQGPKLTTQPSEMVPKKRSVGRTADQVKVYGSKAAFCFEPDQTRAGYHTVAIEAAPAKQGPNREYDWSHKARIQVTRQELPMVAAVFLGLISQIEYKNHGPRNNKGFSFQDQGGNMFGRLFSPEGVKAIPISPEDAFEVSNLVLAQLAKNHPGVSPVDLMVSLGPMVARKAASQNGR